MPSTRTNPRKQPKQWRSKETVECILDGAAQVFERHGYAAGTTNRIAERAGVSVGSVYQYFPNKDAILVALVDRHIEDATKILVPLAAKLIDRKEPLETGLDDLLSAMAAIHREQPNLHRVLFEEAPRPPALKRRLEKAELQANELLRHYLATNDEVALVDIEAAAQLTATVLETVTHRLAITTVSDDEWQVISAHTVSMLHAYLTNPNAPYDATHG